MKNKKLNIILILSTIVLVFILFFVKERLNCFVTNYQLRHNKIIVHKNDSIAFFKQFDYLSNPKTYELSIIELGGKGCKPCMQMDTVLTQLTRQYKNRINVQIYKLNNKQGRVIAKYFGVNTIPTQIILDKSGKEVFRHTGYFPENELLKILEQKGMKK